MKKKLLAILIAVALFVTMLPPITALAASDYVPLDPSQPIAFDGSTVTWSGKTFTLDDQTIFLDYRLDPEQIKDNPYAFRSLQEAKAAGAIVNGTAAKPMMLLTAPGVYWIDDPDDGYVRPSRPTDNPETGLYGMTINCDYLYFYGLNTVRENVVFACARGQTVGSNGNFTLFRIQGNSLKSENVTFGNYTNVDLEFPLDSVLPDGQKLSRPKVSEQIAQAQLFSYSGSAGVAINSGFISRLNLMPFASLYINCRLESSGHSGDNGMHIGCELYFYNTMYSGGSYFDCDIYLVPMWEKYVGVNLFEFGFTESVGSNIVCVDTRFHRGQKLVEDENAVVISWGRPPSKLTRSYIHNVTLDGEPYVIQEYATPGASIQMAEGSDLLKAYKMTADGETHYNVRSVLGNNAAYEPYSNAGVFEAAAVAESKAANHYYSVPRTASLSRSGSGSLQTGGAAVRYTASAESGKSAGLGAWSFKALDVDTLQESSVITLTSVGANQVDVTSTLTGFAPKNVIIVALNTLGIETTAQLNVIPAYIDAPVFTETGTPQIVMPPVYGKTRLDYTFHSDVPGLKDESVINWYRCVDKNGTNPFPIAVSRQGRPEIEYTLTEADVGSYLMAEITPKYNISNLSPTTVKVYSDYVVKASDIPPRFNELEKEVAWVEVDPQNFPTPRQDQIIPGTWTLDGYLHPECLPSDYTPNAGNNWAYQQGGDVRSNLNYWGLNELARGARMYYEPIGSSFGDMTLTAKFAPTKEAGQGFGSATRQFMDVYIKYDLETLSGYALRFQRLTAPEYTALGFNGGTGVDGVAVSLVKYTNGIAEHLPLTNAKDLIPANTITEPGDTYGKKVVTSTFMTECTVELSIANGKFIADITSTAELPRPGTAQGYLDDVHLEADVAMNDFGGTGLLFTGTVGSNACLVTYWNAEMEKSSSTGNTVVTFDYNGGEGAVESKEILYGEPYGELPVPNDRLGYNFLGWSTDGTGEGIVTAATIVEASHTLTAVWEIDIRVAVSLTGSKTTTLKDEVEYILSVGNAKNLATVTVWFEVDGAYLNGKGAEGLNSFSRIGEVQWVNTEESTWIGRVTLGDLNGGSLTTTDYAEILKMTFSLYERTGTTAIKITRIDLSGYDENNKAVYFESNLKKDTVSTEIVPYFSIYDLNRDGKVDQLDLTIAQKYYTVSKGDPEWNDAKAIDFNGDETIGIADLILILNNIVW